MDPSSEQYRSAWERYADETVAFARTGGLPPRGLALLTELFQTSAAPTDAPVLEAALERDRASEKRRTDLVEALGISDPEELREDRSVESWTRTRLFGGPDAGPTVEGAS